MKKAEFQLETVTCPSCIRKIESALSKAEGVGSARVLFTSSKVKAEFDESKTSAERLKGIIGSLGYTVLTSKVS